MFEICNPPFLQVGIAMGKCIMLIYLGLWIFSASMESITEDVVQEMHRMILSAIYDL